MSIRIPGIGPVPEIDRNDELQRISFNKLNSIIPNSLFILREEGGSDKGVDRSLEVLIGNGATNLRAQIQIKGTDSSKFNTDGSFSYPVQASNLNYLLNGCSALYIIWLERNNEFRYAWARDEAERLYRDSPNWQQQDTVTLRFSNVLSQFAWEGIHERIIREGRFQRESRDAITQAMTVEGVTIVINDSLEIVTPDQVYSTLSSIGINLVSAGHAQYVLRHAAILNGSQLADAKIQLVLGYASFSIGDYFTSRGHLARASMSVDQLVQLDRYVLDSILNTCEYHLGMRALDAFQKEQNRIEQVAPTNLAMQLRFDRLRREYLRQQNKDSSQAIFADLLTAAAEIESLPGISESAKIQIAMARVYSESAKIQAHCLNIMFLPKLRRSMGLASLSTEVVAAIRDANAAANDVDKKAIELVKQAVRIGHPLLIAEAIVTRYTPLIIRLVNMHLINLVHSIATEKIPEGIRESIEQQLNRAVKCYDIVGNAEGAVRAKLALVQWLDFNEQTAEAVAIAKEAIATSRAMGYDAHTKTAEQFISGNSDYRRLSTLIQNPPDTDTFLATATPDDIRRWALDTLPALGIPTERLSIVERVCAVNQKAALEKIEWCGHFSLLENLQSFQHSATRYATDPEWRGRCELFGHHSHTRSTNADAVIARFKEIYCKICTDRTPKK